MLGRTPTGARSIDGAGAGPLPVDVLLPPALLPLDRRTVDSQRVLSQPDSRRASSPALLQGRRDVHGGRRAR